MKVLDVLLLGFFLNFFCFSACANASSNPHFLLKPKGPYFVGVKDYHWINTHACPSYFSPVKVHDNYILKHCDEIALSMYYPTERQGGSMYAAANAVIKDAQETNNKLNEKQVDTIKLLKSYTYRNAPIAKGKFPLIMFSSGYGILPGQYENVITALVSYGYIVLAINSAYINGAMYLADGSLAKTVVPTNLQQKQALFKISLDDLTYAYYYAKKLSNSNALFKHIDWNRVGLLGHSLGAATVARFASHFPVKAVVSLDLIFDFYNQDDDHELQVNAPWLHLFSSNIYDKAKELPYLNHKQSSKPNQPVVVLRGSINHGARDYSMHMNFTDYSTLQYQPDMMHVFGNSHDYSHTRMLGIGNGWTIAKDINIIAISFFNHNEK